MKVWVELFVAFFKTGLLTFGGGYAMLPVLKDEVVAKRGFMREDELLNYFAIGQCTPGIIAVNVATFCGYKLRKTWGAVWATFAMILPSLLIIMLIASVFKTLTSYKAAGHILAGVRVGVCALLLKVVWDLCVRIYKNTQNKIWAIFIFAVSGIGLLLGHLSAVTVVVFALLVSLMPLFIKRGKK